MIMCFSASTHRIKTIKIPKYISMKNDEPISLLSLLPTSSELKIKEAEKHIIIELAKPSSKTKMLSNCKCELSDSDSDSGQDNSVHGQGSSCPTAAVPDGLPGAPQGGPGTSGLPGGSGGPGELPG